MEGTCIEKGIVVGMNLIFGLVYYITNGSCVYNKTAENQESFCSFIEQDVTHELMR